jgi:hypothetical protein
VTAAAPTSVAVLVAVLVDVAPFDFLAVSLDLATLAVVVAGEPDLLGRPCSDSLCKRSDRREQKR